MKSIYLDFAATAPLLPTVQARMHQIIDLQASAELGNASALHSHGQLAHQFIEEARANVARLIGADPSEIIFTSGGSESNNTIIHTFAGKNLAISEIEHPSVFEPAKKYAKRCQILKVDEGGFIDPSAVLDDIDLASVMLANNELGSIEPIAELAKCCKNHNTFVHTDATQTFGKLHIDVKELGVDYLTASAHKIGGPQGAGILYCRKGCKLTPLILGGHQENKRRAGTSNLLAIAGLGEAAKWCWDNWSCKKWSQIASLRDQLKDLILAQIPHSSCNSPDHDVLPNILNMSFKAAEGESIQLYLDAEGVAVSTGSACAAGDLRPSRVIMAVKHDAEVAHSSIRFSLGLDTTQADLEYTVHVLIRAIKRLQGMSTIKIEG